MPSVLECLSVAFFFFFFFFGGGGGGGGGGGCLINIDLSLNTDLNEIYLMSALIYV